MKTIICFAACVALASCAGPPAPATVPAQEKPDSIKNPSGIRKPTAEETHAANAAAKTYYSALLKNIEKLDDGTSSPDIIARAAVSITYDLLREKVEAQFTHIRASSRNSSIMLDIKLANLPENSDIDHATYMVLRIRKIKSSPPEEQGKPVDIEAQERYREYLRKLRDEKNSAFGPHRILPAELGQRPGGEIAGLVHAEKVAWLLVADTRPPIQERAKVAAIPVVLSGLPGPRWPVTSWSELSNVLQADDTDQTINDLATKFGGAPALAQTDAASSRCVASASTPSGL